MPKSRIDSPPVGTVCFSSLTLTIELGTFSLLVISLNRFRVSVVKVYFMIRANDINVGTKADLRGTPGAENPHSASELLHSGNYLKKLYNSPISGSQGAFAFQPHLLLQIQCSGLN